MFSLKLDESKLVNNAIAVISDFITEASFDISKDGIKLIAMDPANISMVMFTLLPSVFTEYSVDQPQNIIVNLESFKQALRRAKPNETVSMTLEKNKLKITLAGKSTKRFFIPLLEREGKEHNVPDLEFAAKVELEASELRDYIDDVSVGGEAVTLTADSSALSLAAGDAGSKVNIELKKSDDALISLDAPSEVKAMYSVDYLKKMVKAAALSDTALVQFSSDYPLRLDFKSINKLLMSFILAPRIENK